jgi:hypothetical protein
MEVNIKGISFAYWNELKPAIESRLRNLEVRITLSPNGVEKPLLITAPSSLAASDKLKIAEAIADICSKHSRDAARKENRWWYRGFYIDNLLV